MSSILRLYELAGATDRARFSPNCWRTRLAIAHKQLQVETIAWHFTEKDTIAFSGQGKVPVLMDGDRCLVDSWVIADYLEVAYSDRPSLFGSSAGRSLTRFVNQWTGEVLHPAIARIIIPDIANMLHPMDREYFQTTREASLGVTFAALAAEREENLATLGFANQGEVIAANLFPEGRAPLIVCNPPWIPARPSSALEHAVYDPDNRMLRGFLNGLAEHLEPNGEGWLILSDLAEHLGLRTRAELLALIEAANLRVARRTDIKPNHPRSQDKDDALHAARAAEVTSLWQLAAR